MVVRHNPQIMKESPLDVEGFFKRGMLLKIVNREGLLRLPHGGKMY